ncbi:POTRA domain-containing protein [uncultured Cyclobacterium sp.]|uniref:POTRA domain-containing protein n=1 Tax=uncultured Cyclobacterium sp. TaxID=453820 RepID=UPI0030EF4C88
MLFAALTGAAQDTSYTLKVELFSEGENVKEMMQAFPDSLGVIKYSKAVEDSLQLEGYFSPELKLAFLSEQQSTLTIETGVQTKWLDLSKGNLEPWVLYRLNNPLLSVKNKPFRYKELRRLMEKILDIGQNNGYPFISVRLDSVRQEKDGVSASITMDKGPFITFDTLQVTGNSRTQPIYLARKLGIRPGEPFSQKKVMEATRAIKNVPYISVVSNPELSFQNEEATIYLPVNDRKVNSLDGIIGLLPNEIEANKWLVTGQFDLQLYNVAGRGRDYVLIWQRLSQYSQNLNIEAKEPFVLGTDLDVSVSFNLLKEDTTFLNRAFEFNVGYQLSASTYLSFFGKRQAGDLLATSNYEQAASLPEIADFRYNSYGATFTVNRVDDIILPKRGWQSMATFGLGNKRIIENTGLPAALYVGLKRTSLQYYMKAKMAYYHRWQQNLGLKLSVSAGDMDNANLLLNDLFRLGGLQSIRGFNENYFYTSRYIYLNVEPRFYFGTYSYFLLFTDLGRVESKVGNVTGEWPFSFGGGLNLETSGGIFKFVYALGQAGSQPLGFNYSRIHFGFTGRF